MKELSLSSGQIALVDDIDFEEISKYSWSVSTKGYAYRKGKNPETGIWNDNINMHRSILGLSRTDLMIIDHIDGNKLNNQRNNLRICSNSQNLCNRGKQKNNSSGFKGVSYKPHGGTWSAQIKVGGNSIYIGTYRTAEEAYHAYCLKAVEVHGEFVAKEIRDVANSIKTIPTALKKINRSGFDGIKKRGKYERWDVSFQRNGKREYLGAYSSPEEAHAVYLRAKQEHESGGGNGE